MSKSIQAFNLSTDFNFVSEIHFRWVIQAKDKKDFLDSYIPGKAIRSKTLDVEEDGFKMRVDFFPIGEEHTSWDCRRSEQLNIWTSGGSGCFTLTNIKASVNGIPFNHSMERSEALTKSVPYAGVAYVLGKSPEDQYNVLPSPKTDDEYDTWCEDRRLKLTQEVNTIMITADLMVQDNCNEVNYEDEKRMTAEEKDQFYGKQENPEDGFEVKDTTNGMVGNNEVTISQVCKASSEGEDGNVKVQVSKEVCVGDSKESKVSEKVLAPGEKAEFDFATPTVSKEEKLSEEDKASKEVSVKDQTTPTISKEEKLSDFDKFCKTIDYLNEVMKKDKKDKASKEVDQVPELVMASKVDEASEKDEISEDDQVPELVPASKKVKDESETMVLAHNGGFRPNDPLAKLNKCCAHMGTARCSKHPDWVDPESELVDSFCVL